ncbi:MAG: gliding motility-associated transporter permease subunit GldF [Bacteroidota bacterium]
MITGLFMWVLPDSNQLDYGYATMEKFFDLAPWMLLFLIPAITMRTFPEERRSGTLEILFTKPLRDLDVILGKYFAAIVLVALAILPTLLYILTLYNLKQEGHSLDSGGIIGSYIGLMCLASSFAAVGMFCSALTQNQVVSFLTSLVACFLLYQGFESISAMPAFRGTIDLLLSKIGMQFHYYNISKGYIDTREVVYFATVAIIFILSTQLALRSRNWEKK